MKKLDKFILKAFIGPFLGILFIVIFVLMMQFLWLYIDELVGKGLSLSVILEFLMWGACTILPLALPLATLLAAMMTLGQMSEHNELMALKCAGISLLRILTPLIVSASIISIAAYFSGNNLVPKAYNEIFTLRDDIGKTKKEINIPSGIFYEGIDGYVLRIDSQDKKSGMMKGVMVYDHTKNNGNTSIIIADSAKMIISENKDYLIFTLHSGSSYQEDNSIAHKDTTHTLNKISFEKQELTIPLSNYKFEQSGDARFEDQIKSMRFSQLKQVKDSIRILLKEDADRHYTQLIETSHLILRQQLDTSIALGSSTVFSDENFLKWDNNAELINAYNSAASEAGFIKENLKSYVYADYEHLYYLHHSDVELLKKIAQALACIILFFIGAPLGALVRKGGLGMGAIAAALFFVLYWVIDISGTKLANDGETTAFIGAFISALILLPLGIFLTYKAMHDASIFSAESAKSLFRKLRSKIKNIFHKTRIVYMGTPEFAVAPLKALLNEGYKVVGVVTTADKPSGRGLKLNQSAVKEFAVANNIPVLQPLKLRDPEFLKKLADLKADLFVVVAFRMLPEEVWKMPRLGTFNLHAALLPQYRGAAPINWAVINGEKMTGVTTFMIDKDIDTGGIILREECKIGPEDTAGDIHDKLMEIGSQLVTKTVEGIIEQSVETRVQRSFIQGSEVLRSAPKITRELCHIDWSDSTENIYNLIRGLSPYPAAFTEITKDGCEPLQLKIFKASRMMDIHATEGTIISDGKKTLAIATADGAVAIEELQLSGKKRMSTKDFLLGFREPEGWSTTQGSSKEICRNCRG